jgi:hypothetical protein
MSSTLGIPASEAEALSAAWLSAALGTRFPGIEVLTVTPGPVVSRMSTNIRFHIETRGPLPEGLPADLCIKGYWRLMAAAQAGEPEAMFYRDLADFTGVRTLRHFYADIDPANHHGVVITEDVVASGATFLDSLSPYTPDQVAASLELYAQLHSATWQAPEVPDEPWLGPRLAQTLRGRGLDVIQKNFAAPTAAGIPAAARDAQRLVHTVDGMSAVLAADPSWCVLHGDAHIGNFFLDKDGEPALLDWQLVQRGPWYIDVGYHIASALSVADRRANEHDLVAHYLDEMKKRGVDLTESDDLWFGLRCGIVYGFFLWAITLKVDPPITTELCTRLGTAVADHEAYEVVPG